MTVKHPAKCDVIPAERPFLLAAERVAIASVRPDPLAPFAAAGCPDGGYADSADALESILPTLTRTDLHPVSAPRLAARLAAMVPHVPETALLAFCREELLHEADERGLLLDPYVISRLRYFTQCRFG
jgi:hypothetical protein